MPRKNPLQRYLEAASPTRKQAVDAMCYRCMGASDTDQNGVREEIRGCTSPACPLYAFRPHK